MHVDLEITVMCEAMKKGCTFVAVAYDRKRQRRFSQNGATAWEAIAWFFDDYIAVVKYGCDPSMALNSSDTPGSRFPRLEAAQKRAQAVQQAMQQDANEWAAKHGVTPPTIEVRTPSTASFDNQIPRKAVPTPAVAKPSAAARRSSAKKKAK